MMNTENAQNYLPEEEQKKDPILEAMDKVDVLKILELTVVATDLPIPRRDAKANSIFNRQTGIDERNVTLLDLLKYQFVKAGRRLFEYEKPVELTMKIGMEMDKEHKCRDNVMSIETSADVVLSKCPKSTPKNSSYVLATGSMSLDDPRVQTNLFSEKQSRRNNK